MQALAKLIYFKVLGWQLTGTFPNVGKCVVVVAPHTSWVDFFLGLLVRRVVNEKISYIGKESLFRPPFGWFFRWMGGTPVDRSQNNNTVSSITTVFRERNVFRLALSPEGTRKKVNTWKTGFYYIAKKAQVPLVLVSLDYGKKQVNISELFWPTTNKEADFKTYKAFFKGVTGRVPEYS